MSGVDGPDDVALRLSGAAADPVELRARAARAALPPYAHVLLDLVSGTNDLAVGGEGAEQAWRVVTPVLAAWEGGDVPLEEYAAGSAGPAR